MACAGVANGRPQSLEPPACLRAEELLLEVEHRFGFGLGATLAQKLAPQSGFGAAAARNGKRHEPSSAEANCSRESASHQKAPPAWHLPQL